MADPRAGSNLLVLRMVLSSILSKNCLGHSRQVKNWIRETPAEPASALRHSRIIPVPRDDSPRTSPFPDSSPEILNTLVLMKRCPQIAGIEKSDPGRIQAQTWKTRP
jgi:hypothetical protein